MRNLATVRQPNLSGFNINLPTNIKTGFSQAKTGRDMRINLCRGARAIAQQMGTYQSRVRIVKPIGEILRTSLGGSGMASQAVAVGEAVVVVEEAAVVTAAVDGVILSAEATAILGTAEAGVVVAEGATVVTTAGGVGAGLSVGAGVAIGVGAGVIIIVIAICWYLASNLVPADKRGLLNQEFAKLINDVKKSGK